jgi:hypothetical protein
MDGGVINHSNKAAYHTEKLSIFRVACSKMAVMERNEDLQSKMDCQSKKFMRGQIASQASKLGTQSVVSQFRRIAARQGARRPAC